MSIISNSSILLGLWACYGSIPSLLCMVFSIIKFVIKRKITFDSIRHIINERYIPEHQNKLNIYDLQTYEFLPNFFQPKKIRKIR